MGEFTPAQAHPRSRGENAEPKRDPLGVAGSSPLTRGKRRGCDGTRRRRWLIPAHAGKTSRLSCPSRRLRAHPRSRGENTSQAASVSRSIGSSPLTRGKRRRVEVDVNRLWLIPAHAGKTGIWNEHRWRQGAHPRSRGENRELTVDAFLSGSSSPLTRGKPAGP